MRIRDPRPADAAELGRLHADAWQAAYAGLMPAAILDDFTAERRERAWNRLLAQERPARAWIGVAEVDGQVAGFAHTGTCRDEDAPEASGELYAINVAPGWWGHGAGTALIDASHRALHEAGFAEAVLWVLPGNDRARRFYEARGWHADGAHREIRIGESAVPEIRYARSLS